MCAALAAHIRCALDELDQPNDAVPKDASAAEQVREAERGLHENFRSMRESIA